MKDACYWTVSGQSLLLLAVILQQVLVSTKTCNMYIVHGYRAGAHSIFQIQIRSWE
jgi:hypothetical protein